MASGDIIWTTRAIKQMKLFGLSRATVAEAFHHPTETSELSRGTKKGVKVMGEQEVGFAFRKNDRGNWVILSCWLRPLPKKR
jgi:hypothetical protein